MTIRDLLRTLPVFGRPLPGFDPDQAPDDPASLFASWLGQAVDAQVVEPHVMTLSTVDAHGRPDARVVMLRDVSAEGWQFTASSTGVKGAQLADAPTLVAPDHTVYTLTPAEVEFWQGDRQRQHIRLRYRRAGPGWVAERLWP